jgi:hypothetical protein
MSLFPSNPDEIGDELDDLTRMLQSAQDCDSLSDWEIGFVEDMLDRVIQYGKRTRVSERQQEILDRIQTKVDGC